MVRQTSNKPILKGDINDTKWINVCLAQAEKEYLSIFNEVNLLYVVLENK